MKSIGHLFEITNQIPRDDVIRINSSNPKAEITQLPYKKSVVDLSRNPTSVYFPDTVNQRKLINEFVCECEEIVGYSTLTPLNKNEMQQRHQHLDISMDRDHPDAIETLLSSRSLMDSVCTGSGVTLKYKNGITTVDIPEKVISSSSPDEGTDLKDEVHDFWDESDSRMGRYGKVELDEEVRRTEEHLTSFSQKCIAHGPETEVKQVNSLDSVSDSRKSMTRQYDNHIHYKQVDEHHTTNTILAGNNCQHDTADLDSIACEIDAHSKPADDGAHDFADDVSDDFDILGAKLVSMLLKFSSRSNRQSAARTTEAEKKEPSSATTYQQLTVLESRPHRGSSSTDSSVQDGAEAEFDRSDSKPCIGVTTSSAKANRTVTQFGGQNALTLKANALEDTTSNELGLSPSPPSCGYAPNRNNTPCMETTSPTSERVKDLISIAMTSPKSAPTVNHQAIERLDSQTFDYRPSGHAVTRKCYHRVPDSLHPVNPDLPVRTASNETAIQDTRDGFQETGDASSRKRSYSRRLLASSYESYDGGGSGGGGGGGGGVGDVGFRMDDAIRTNDTVPYHRPSNPHSSDCTHTHQANRSYSQHKSSRDWKITKSSARTEGGCLHVFNTTTDFHFQCNEYRYSKGIDMYTPSASPMLPSAHPPGRYHHRGTGLSPVGRQGMDFSFNWSSLDSNSGSLYSPRPRLIAPSRQSNGVSHDVYSKSQPSYFLHQMAAPSVHPSWPMKMITQEVMTSSNARPSSGDSPESKSLFTDRTLFNYPDTPGNSTSSSCCIKSPEQIRTKPRDFDLMSEVLRSSAEDRSCHSHLPSTNSPLNINVPSLHTASPSRTSTTHRTSPADHPFDLDLPHPAWKGRSRPSTSQGSARHQTGVVSSRKSGLPPCRICGDRASGLHFGVNSCEACNEFYRRTLKRNSQYACAKGRQCDVVGRKRSSCSYCRFQKCVSEGMSRSAIKTGRYSHQKRALYTLEIKGMERLRADREKEKRMTDITQDLLLKHKHFFMTTSEFTKRELSPEFCGDRRHFLSIPSLDDVMTEKYMEEEATSTEEWIRQLIKFVKNVDIFEDITLTDQAALIRMSWFEIRFLDSFQHFSFDQQLASDPTRRLLSFDQLAMLHSHDLASDIFKVAHKLNRLDVTDEELVLMKCLYLTLSDRYVLADQLKVASLNEFLSNSLLHALDRNHNGKGLGMFPRVVDCFIQLRSLAWAYFEGFSNFYVHHVTKNSQLLAEMIPVRENM